MKKVNPIMTASPVSSSSSLKALLSRGGRGLPSSILSLSLLLLLLLLRGEASADDTIVDTTTVDVVNTNVDEYYNVNETRGEFEFRIQPYPIPIETTTYIDVVFNLPDDLPPLVHIVFGEAIISQPKHLHHFVLTGCTTKYDVQEEGVPLDSPPSDCFIPLAQWAPGSGLFSFGTTPDLSVGVAIGSAMGVQAVALNIHYTDGEYEDDGESYKIATDGIKVYYTTDLRDYTSVNTPLINVAFGPLDMYVPPSTERYFLTKTCMVDTKCKDATDKQLQVAAYMLGLSSEEENTADTKNDTDTAISEMLANISCPTFKPFCSMGGEIGSYVQQLCPVTCGLCSIGNSDNDGNDNNGENPRNPTSYRATSIIYHAHLLGSEMYATLLREKDEGDEMIVKDLKSSEFWNFDYQAATAMDNEYEIQVDTSSSSTTTSDGNEGIELVKGVAIKAGDKIQATCVYNSMYREKKTRFGLTTYDEMCFIHLQVTFKTPPVVLDDDFDGTTVGGIDFNADLNLRTFSCEVMDDSTTTTTTTNEDSSSTSTSTSPSSSISPVVLSDIWLGALDINEDPRTIWEDHPITTTDTCTFFPVVDFELFDLFLPLESRNCPATVTDDYDHDSSSICYGFETSSGKVEFLDDSIAGYTCVGGTYNEKDSNENVTEEDCLVDGGGTSYDAYTCLGLYEWLQVDAIALGITDQEQKNMKENWWQPTCCREVVVVSFEDEDEDGGVAAAGATATANVTVIAEEESSSSTYSSAFDFAIVASFFVMIMVL